MSEAKVSMVVPCYNKERYIGALLGSIYGQNWDNIEVILVNDGSTDGTLGVIRRWEPRLRGRGYEVVVVDQENAGVCAATRNGMLRMTGGYFCTVDADDELEPEYVSAAAGFLEENRDYAWVSCAFNQLIDDGHLRVLTSRSIYPFSAEEPHNVENFLFGLLPQVPWQYLVRAEYVRRCNVMDHYAHSPRGSSHEPGLFLPLAFGGGACKLIEKPLYQFKRFASEMSNFDVVEKQLQYYEGYFDLCDKAFDSVRLPENQVEYFKAVAQVARYQYFLRSLEYVKEFDARYEHWLEECVAFVNAYLKPKRALTAARAKDNGILELFLAIADTLWLNRSRKLASLAENACIIGYGALGKVAAKYLPLLQSNGICPGLLWDINAGANSSIGGQRVTAPAFSALPAHAVILVFPAHPQVTEEVKRNIPAHCDAALISRFDIALYLAVKKYPDFQKQEGSLMKKLLFVYDALSILGGAETALVNLLCALPKEDYEIDLLLLYKSSGPLMDRLPSHVRILPAPLPLQKWTPAFMAWLRMNGMAHAADVRDKIHAWNVNGRYGHLSTGERLNRNWDELTNICPVYGGYDVAIAYSEGIVLKIVADNVTATKKVAWLHNDFRYREVTAKEQERYYSKMDRIVSYIPQSAQVFADLLPNLRAKLSTAPYLHRPDIFQMADGYTPAEFKRGVPAIFSASRITKNKGIPLIIDTAALLRSRGLNFIWVVAGKIYDDFPEYQQQMDQKELREHLLFIGEKENPYPYFKHCDLFVHAARYEGKCIAIEEAKIFGCPIVSTNFPSVTDSLQDGRNAFICEMDPARMAAAMQTLLEEGRRLQKNTHSYVTSADMTAYRELFYS